MALAVDGSRTQALDRAGRVFSALADPTRRAIVRELSVDGPHTATGLAARVGVSRQAAAKHLAELALAGLATGARSGREHRFTLRTAPFAEAEAWMRAIGAMWDQRLAAFERLVDQG
jgi:DNA-binding transcriptional ArsR family regulator